MTDEQVPVRVTAVEIIDGVEVPIGKPRETTISRGALDLLHGGYPHEAELQRIADEARADRIDRALSAGLDAWADVVAVPVAGDRAANAARDAIEAATRVRVDSDITQAVRDAHPDIMIKTTELKGMIETAFRAAGFEVEQ